MIKLDELKRRQIVSPGRTKKLRIRPILLYLQYTRICLVDIHAPTVFCTTEYENNRTNLVFCSTY